MKRCAIVYKSKYGTTKQYAQWIAEETGGDIFELPKVSVRDILPYDVIVLGGGLYAGGMLGFSFLKKNFQALSEKKIVIFSVGASLNSEANREAIQKANLTPEMKGMVHYFHLRGGLDYPSMGMLDRFAMWCMKKVLEGKKESERDEESRGILATYGKKVSFLDRKSIEPLLEEIRR